MSIPRWTPSQTLSARETKLLARHKRSRKLFVFLRLYRHELFDDAFQAELESIYRSTGAGKLPCPPALLAMAMLASLLIFGLSTMRGVTCAETSSLLGSGSSR